MPGVSCENVAWMLFFYLSYSAPVLPTHSATIISRFDFSNSYIWFEFYNAPLENDVSIICDASNFSFTLVMVFWTIKLNHYEAYVAYFCRHFDHGILLGVLVDAIPWICKYVENFLAIKKCWQMKWLIVLHEKVVELYKVKSCQMEST